jgi:tripartite-type tricarboxylate transporter receptor subunit TctC
MKPAGGDAMTRLLNAIAASLLLLGAATPAARAEWPDRPIRFISSQAAGNATDTLARLTADLVGKRLGQSIVVENRSGGGNVIGTQAAARSAPDGYTFFFATAAPMVSDPYTFKSLPYDTQKDFVPVARVAEVSFVILAHPSVPANTLKDVFEIAKKDPNKLTFATDGERRFSGMIVAWLNKLAGTHIVQVPYKAQTQGVQDTIAGRVQLVIVAVPGSRELIKSGKLKAIAVTTAKRSPVLPDVQTVAETFPGFDFPGWWLVVAPTGTPQPIIDRMNKEINTVMKDEAVVKRLTNIAFTITAGYSPKETGDYVKSQYEAWGRVVKEIGIKPE